MDEQQETVFDSWAKFLNPATLRQNLIAASMFLAAFESLKSSIIDPIRSFLATQWDSNGPVEGPEYKNKVLGRHKSRLRASLLWLRDMDVVDEVDIAMVDRIREHRNELAHQLMKYIAQSDSEIDVELIGKILELVAKIDRWWILEVEVPTNPDYDGREIDASRVMSGSMMVLEMMVEAAAGNEFADEVYKSFMEKAGEQGFMPGPAA